MIDDMSMWNFLGSLLGAPLAVRFSWFMFSIVVFVVASATFLFAVPLILPDEITTKNTTPTQNQQTVTAQPSTQKQQNVTLTQSAQARQSVSNPELPSVRQTALVQQNSRERQKEENSIGSIDGSPNIQIGHIAQDGTEEQGISIGNTVEKKRDIIGGFHLTARKGSQVTINVNDGFSVDRRTVEISSDTGGQAKIEIYMLFNSASWSYGSSSNIINHYNGAINLTKFLESKDFSVAAEQYNAIVCLGLASGLARGDIEDTLDLADERATHLCGLISRKAYIDSSRTKIFGLPLGYNRNTNVDKNTSEERKQRSIVIIGIKSTSGSLDEEKEKQNMITAILKDNALDGFRSSDYSEVASKAQLRYLRIERGVFSSR